MQTQIEEYVHTCHICQITKKKYEKYRLPLAKKAKIEPWIWINVNLVGPYTIDSITKIYTLRAITMIDPAIGWFEIAYMNEPNSETT